MSDSALRGAHELLASRVGLRFDPVLRGRLDRCLRDAADQLAEGDLDRYAQMLYVDNDVFQDLLNRITVQETAFFRHAAQLEAGVAQLPPVAAHPIVWSAGCATGQEPYSLAMALIEAGRDGYRVLGTDISTDALARAERGVYTETEMRGVSDLRRRRFFLPVDQGWEVRSEVRQRVTFERHNLVAPSPPSLADGCQMIFCRNVLIYMDRRDLLRVLASFRRVLPADGLLFLGYAESLWQVSEEFMLERVGSVFAYRPSAPDRAAAVPPPGPPTSPPSDAAVAPPPRRRASHRGRVRTRQEEEQGLPTITSLWAEAETASRAGDPHAAIVALRKIVYLDPDQPLAHYEMGCSLEATGDRRSALRAYRASLAALDRVGEAHPLPALEGYRWEQLRQTVETKLTVEP